MCVSFLRVADYSYGREQHQSIEIVAMNNDDDRMKSSRRKPPGAVGYKNPPTHSRFKPGQSGNPSGRPKGSQNLKTLFHKIMKEEVQLREGSDVSRVTKAEALMRGLVIGALKGDTRSTSVLLRLAEQMGQFDEEPGDSPTEIRRIIITGVPRHGDEISAISDLSKED
jgi:hypothetical protein